LPLPLTLLGLVSLAVPTLKKASKQTRVQPGAYSKKKEAEPLPAPVGEAKPAEPVA